MLDIVNIPGQQDNIKIFYASDANTWQAWNKPRNCKFIWMMCIGAGSGGFGGGSGAGLTGAPGGPGGATTKALFPANTLPDTLYIQPGLGSTGGAGAITNINNVPNVPGRSFIAITPSSALIMNIVCTSGTANASGATPETAATVAAAGLLLLGNFTSVAGPAVASIGSNLVPLTTNITCAGANSSAAGANAGANISSVDLGTYSTPLIAGGAAGAIGNSGIWFWKPMFGLGASGGGSVVSGVAGNGGDTKSYGCGGGGGGNSSTGTGGNGGRGGDGLVIIATF